MGIETHIDSPLAEAVRIAGGQSPFGRLVVRNQSTVFDWLRFGKQLPAELVLTVEQATGVSKHLLRPDIYPPEAGVPPCSAPSVAGGVPVVPYDRDAVSDKGAA